MLDLDIIEKQINNDQQICPNIIKNLINEIRELRQKNNDDNDTLLAAYMAGRYDGKKDIINGAK